MGRQTSTLRQYVYDNWREGTGPCEECPLSGPCLGQKEGSTYETDPQGAPNFAAINPDAEIMLVNNTPGYDSNNQRRPYSGTPPEKYLTTPPKLSKYSYDENGREDDARDRYTYKVIEEWSNVNQLGKKLISKSDERDDNTIKWDSFYYTNSLKCTEYDKTDEAETKARSSCVENLRMEIFEIVKPKVIITGGARATATTLAALDREIDTELDSKYTLELNGNSYSSPPPKKFIRKWVGDNSNSQYSHPMIGDDPVLIPTCQFSRALGNGAQAIPDNLDYGDLLYSSVSRIIS